MRNAWSLILSTIKLLLTILLVLLFSQSCTLDLQKCIPGNLRCENMKNPVGIDERHPRLTWQMYDDRMGAAQTSYRLTIGTDSAEVAGGNGNIWNSGKISSDHNLVVYEGDSLKPFTRYFWAVTIWGQARKRSDVSPVASFETGMMNQGNWKGSWISDSRDVDLKPAPYFRKTFTVSGKIKSARQYIAVAGLYELYINGKRIGDHQLDPAYTRFDRRTLYLTHDITSFIKEGKNTVVVLLGNGWYNHQSTAVWYFDKAPWRARPNFCTDIRITLENDSVQYVKSDTDWKTALSPVIFNSIYTGEHYDANMEYTEVYSADFDDSGWNNAIAVSAPSMNITAQIMQPIRFAEVIPAVSFKQLNSNTWLYDLGRNIAGVSSFTVTGEKGTEIRLKHAERLDSKGYADQSNIDVHYRPTNDSDPFQTDILILSGKGEETFTPRFNYKGFQYVEITSSKPIMLKIESLRGIFMHSDVPVAGKINSSDTLLNKIWQATNNSYLSNLFGYPTDCPQREKNGWTGDAHIASETGLYNFDGITVYEKWIHDHMDEQAPNGVLPAIIPTSGWGYHWANGPDWTSTIAIIPWNIYLFYGDSRLLSTCYDNIKRYVDHITDISPSGLTDWGLGDWIPIKSVALKELTSSVYYYTDVLILSKAAKLFGRQEDQIKYAALADKIRKAINLKYLNSETGIYGKGLQTELCVPLYWGIVPEELRSKVAGNLANSITNNNNSMDVGLLGTKAILNALSENGYADLAYKLATRDTFPSWGWWIKNGANTLYENWPIDSKSDISMNHIMFGEIGAWMYKALGGIFPDERNPGFRNVILKPSFVTGLEYFEAEHDGPYGKIVSSWKREGEKIAYKVVIPANSTATLYISAADILENGKKLTSNEFINTEKDEKGNYMLFLKAGQYNFTISR
jgi:alpha-L-rhamnosidase